MKWIEKNPLIAIILCGVSIFLFHLNVLPVSIMEARNFITAREMLNDGHWLLTTMNDLPRYQKPPLPSWITAFFGALFGESIVSYRVPAMLMAIVMGCTCYKFSLLILKSKKQALINALILLTSFYIIIITNEGPWDIYTHTFMLIGVYFLFQFFESQKKVWKHSFLAAIFIGLSFMSKGPVSMYTVLLPFLIAYGIVYKFSAIKQRVFPLIAFLTITTVIGLWWYLYVRYADPQTFGAIAKQETNNWSNYNIRPFYYYWSFFTQTGIWTLPAFISLLYPYLKNRVSHKKAYKFTLLWVLLSVFLLSLIPEKKTRYLVPVIIPLAINTGFYIEYIIRSFKTQCSKKEKIPVYVHFGLIALIGIIFPFLAFFISNDLDGLWLYYIITGSILFGIGILLVLQLLRKKIQYAFFLTITFIMVIKALGGPLFEVLQRKDYSTNIASFTTSLQHKKKPIYAYNKIEPEMVWYYGKSIPVIKNETVFSMSKENSFFILVSYHDKNEFKRIFEGKYTIIHQETFNINSNKINKRLMQKEFASRLTRDLYLIKKQP